MIKRLAAAARDAAQGRVRSAGRFVPFVTDKCRGGVAVRQPGSRCACRRRGQRSFPLISACRLPSGRHARGRKHLPLGRRPVDSRAVAALDRILAGGQEPTALSRRGTGVDMTVSAEAGRLTIRHADLERLGHTQGWLRTRCCDQRERRHAAITRPVADGSATATFAGRLATLPTTSSVRSNIPPRLPDRESASSVVDAAAIIRSTENGVSAATHPGCPCNSTSMCMCRYETIAAISANSATQPVVVHRPEPAGSAAPGADPRDTSYVIRTAQVTGPLTSRRHRYRPARH
jgi:hypothetical protein